jgi:hypothetical protein
MMMIINNQCLKLSIQIKGGIANIHLLPTHLNAKLAEGKQTHNLSIDRRKEGIKENMIKNQKKLIKLFKS